MSRSIGKKISCDPRGGTATVTETEKETGYNAFEFTTFAISVRHAMRELHDGSLNFQLVGQWWSCGMWLDMTKSRCK